MATRQEQARTLRAKIGWTQMQVAIKLELSLDTIQRYEQGRATVPKTYILALRYYATQKRR
jgi:transcriptional regulator with XRE-family HTH domain